MTQEIDPALLEELSTLARNYLRDFPKFFQTSFDAVGRTYQLGQINIDKPTFWVATTSGASATELADSQYSLDTRNGVLRLATTPAAGSRIMVEGYYYEWFLPEDLDYYVKRAIYFHDQTIHIPIESANKAVKDTVGMAGLIEALWALMTEYSRDIDVMTSESIHIPGSQRFRMLQALIAQWEAEYRKHANNLNIGPERIEIMNLRRVSRTTNRLVPLFVAKELGDYDPYERIFVDDHPQQILLTDEESLRDNVYIDGDPPTGIPTNAYF
jgi:hypothetical protein